MNANSNQNQRNQTELMKFGIENVKIIEWITKLWDLNFKGKRELESIELVSEGKIREIEARALFVMIGASPNIAWLDDCISQIKK